MFENILEKSYCMEYNITKEFRTWLQEGVPHMFYKRLIIELVEKSSDVEMLELVYRFCKKLLG